MRPVGKDPPEGPPGGTKIEPKSKKCVIFSMLKHDHFLGRLQDQFFLCFGSLGGSKSMVFRVPEGLPACFGSFYAHMQILSPLPCFFKVFQDVKTLKNQKKRSQIRGYNSTAKKLGSEIDFFTIWARFGYPRGAPKPPQSSSKSKK